jgi:hypothetical protein
MTSLWESLSLRLGRNDKPVGGRWRSVGMTSLWESLAPRLRGELQMQGFAYLAGVGSSGHTQANIRATAIPMETSTKR